MDILFVANWSSPNIVGANYASSGVHLELSKRKLNIGVLSSIIGHHTKDNNVKDLKLKDHYLVELKSNSITYLMPSLPKGWSARHISNDDWDNAVKWGVALLKKYKPKIIHIQQWQNFWWMAEAANKCAIPYNYTPYDFGLICARTVLIKSDGSKCDGPINDATCKKCIYDGRGAIGKLNENLVKIPIFRSILKLLLQYLPLLKLHERGIIVDPINIRLKNDRVRLHNLLSNLDHLIVNSNFSKHLFSSKAKINNVVLIPWFHNLIVSNSKNKKPPKLARIGFVSRISPEKGLDILLESMIKVNKLLDIHIKLIVAGDFSSEYAAQLKIKYFNLDIEWLGWVDSKLLSEVYNRIDMLVVPSISYDNGPITIMEAIATKTPVIVSNNETLMTYLKNIETEHTFKSGSSDSLAKLILKYANDPKMIDDYISELPEPVTVEMYVDDLIQTYQLN
jgi:glycosyltransferase involved in cell wall biosynthesis